MRAPTALKLKPMLKLSHVSVSKQLVSSAPESTSAMLGKMEVNRLQFVTSESHTLSIPELPH